MHGYSSPYSYNFEKYFGMCVFQSEVSYKRDQGVKYQQLWL